LRRLCRLIGVGALQRAIVDCGGGGGGEVAAEEEEEESIAPKGRGKGRDGASCSVAYVLLVHVLNFSSPSNLFHPFGLPPQQL